MTAESQAKAHARLEALYDDHARTVFRYARRRLSREDAEEVVCDVFVVAWRRLDDIPDLALAWLLGVARKTVANRLRAGRRFGALTEHARLQVRRSTPDHASAVAAGDEIAWAFGQLSDKDQDILRLVITEGLSTPELGVALGCSTNTASARARRARERLAALCQQTSGPAPDASRTATRTTTQTSGRGRAEGIRHEQQA